MSATNGGPAFPRPLAVICNSGSSNDNVLAEKLRDALSAQPGMSLRDLYAGLAMHALLGNGELAKLWSGGKTGQKGKENEDFASWMKLAYQFSWWVADQMLYVREKGVAPE